MTELITLNLTLKELQQIDKFVEINDDTLSVIMKITNAYPKQKSPAEEAYKEVYGWYPPTTSSVSNFEDTRWSAFQMGYNTSKVGEYQPTSQTPEEVDAGLRNAMRQAKEEGVFDEPTKPMDEVVDRLENKYKDAEENTASYITDDVVNRMLKEWEENPPDFLKFELGKTLEALITRWWCDVFTTHEDWDMETAIDDLCDRVELWLPKSQSSSGSQSLGVEDMVEGFNDCIKKIKSKLRNKK